MGEEAKNPKKDIPRAVILSLTIQGLICYMFEYFAANYFLSSAYSLKAASGSAAPIGDMMTLVGDALLGGHGEAFMLIEAFTVFLALIGTTLSCINTGARVTYAMAATRKYPSIRLSPWRKPDTPSSDLDPGRNFCGTGCDRSVGLLYWRLRTYDDAMKTLPHNIWYAFGLGSSATMASLPNGLLTVTLLSNFGTFVLYGLTNIVCIVAFRERS